MIVLNNLNDRIVKVCVLEGNPTINPDEYVVTGLTGIKFGITHAINNSTVVPVGKVDLTNLFKDIPQSIHGISFDGVPNDNAAKYQSYVATNSVTNYPDVGMGVTESSDSEMSGYFCNWKRLVGINDLYIQDVDLSMDEGKLIIDVKNSTKYMGTVSVTVKVAEV